ncbi:carbohydrate esterase family 4 protein, partial [Piromyces sp. E2]
DPKHWAMTYDDGPTEFTDAMLDLFKEYNIKVTFFVSGNLYIKAEDPEWIRIIKRMYDEGHVIGNHTFNHINLNEASIEDIKNEIQQITDAIYNVIGKKPAFTRLPYGAGATNFTVLDTLQDLGYTAAVNWNVDTMDWGNEGDIEYSKKVITEQLGNPLITLNHLAYGGATVEGIVALGRTEIEYILENGYTPVTMEECL